MLAGCSDDSAQNAAAVAALSAWWTKDTTPEVTMPDKPGTVTPAHTLTILGKPLLIRRHVQTKAEYDEQLKDYEWAKAYAAHQRSIVTGFRVSDNTVTVLTKATRNSTSDLNSDDEKRDAQELCHQVSGFIWSRSARHLGLKNIKVLGVGGELLSWRTGLGKVE
jgi:hypothetical protein